MPERGCQLLLTSSKVWTPKKAYSDQACDWTIVKKSSSYERERYVEKDANFTGVAKKKSGQKFGFELFIRNFNDFRTRGILKNRLTF